MYNTAADVIPVIDREIYIRRLVDRFAWDDPRHGHCKPRLSIYTILAAHDFLVEIQLHIPTTVCARAWCAKLLYVYGVHTGGYAYMCIHT